MSLDKCTRYKHHAQVDGVPRAQEAVPAVLPDDLHPAIRSSLGLLSAQVVSLALV